MINNCFVHLYSFMLVLTGALFTIYIFHDRIMQNVSKPVFKLQIEKKSRPKIFIKLINIPRSNRETK